MIELKQVSKAFGFGHSRIEVLKQIDLRVEPGTLTVLLGRSGSGKSTLVNLIGGLDRPDTGTVEAFGNRLEAMDAEQLAGYRLNHVGLVFQFFNLLPTLSLRDNAAIAGQLKGYSAEAIERRVDQALQQVGLTDQADRMPHEASGGEIQRAAIARALIAGPDIILADEPTGNLDTGNREAVAQIFHDLVRKDRRTVLMVTHDESLTAIADRVLHLENGRLSG